MSTGRIMKPQRRPYQAKLVDDIYREWNAGHRNVVAVMPTGAGKTKTFVSMISEINGEVTIIAHRRELVGQISATVAEFEIPHNIIAAGPSIRNCVHRHVHLFNRSFFDKRSRVTVASVDTILANQDKLAQWGSQQNFWITDECHHVLTDNKWGKAVNLFPNAYGLGVTATPIRADRKSLARSQNGVFDRLVVGPSMRDLINQGHLCDYMIYAPPASIRIENLKVGASGDYTGDSVRKEAHESKIVGDMVAHYHRFAAGKRTIAFAVDVDQAEEIAARFRDAGFRAAAVDGTTPETVRDLTVDKFSRGQLDILVNVDLFGEGFDVPAVECVIMGRPTQSYGLFVQQFGRALRPLDGKPVGIIIDCVGNVGFHGLPDAPRTWRLENDERGRRRDRDPDVVPVRRCEACFRAFEAFRRACPFCGHMPEPAGRDRPEQVEGDLALLDPAVLAQMRGEIDRIDGPPAIPPHLIGTPAEKAIVRTWLERQKWQGTLRDRIAQWAGFYRQDGHDVPEIQRRFYYRFGTDVATAQTLGGQDAGRLVEQIDIAISDLLGRYQ